MISWNRIAADDKKGKSVKRVLVVGAGASGMMAAIQASKHGAAVTIYEKTDRVGKKILATGNGKCNLANEDMDLSNYFCADKDKLAGCFARFSTNDTIAFFEKSGLMIRSRDGYLYPYCEQASVVLDVLRAGLKKCGVQVETSVTDICLSVKKNNKFMVESSLGKKEFDSVILACGSKAGMKNATTEGFNLAKGFGHRIIPLLPALVQVRCEETFFPAVAGVRCKAKIGLFVDEKAVAYEQGELQLTDYGISGIPVFQISRIIAAELKAGNRLCVETDFVPHMTDSDWEQFILMRYERYAGDTAEAFFTGMLHKKISMMLLKEYGLKADDVICESVKERVMEICLAMKHFKVTPKSVNGYEQAQVCSGGVDFAELDENLESVYQPGLFICGEMVDVDGKCGGYNLQWAWTSGSIAGSCAAGNKL